ncbi:hypothetical protein [Thermogemmatispora carboxidivorans]|uniref:hypothetical protein n=1 Tax=Thermogemmatispora carboxidivorans TaxID=1382306 RepID=UPI00069A84F0|nr:hypothetical protein [Thermogemmatispora carboxidivorans]
MSNEWEQSTNTPGNPLGPNDIDKRLEELGRALTQGVSEVQQQLKKVVDRASTYWQQSQTVPRPAPSSDIEEQRIRQLVNSWSAGNWRVARDLGTYMDIVAMSRDEVWEITVQTRWEHRALEIVSEPYSGQVPGKPQPLLPVWDYELPAVSDLRPPATRTRLEGLDELLACTTCNGTGRALCTECSGRGWITCPDCRGRTRKRCTTCRGRGYVADWAEQKKRPFLQRRVEKLTNALGERVSTVFEGIRQQGLLVPNPLDTDPANKGRVIPCPDCINGEVDCDCVTGKRVCPACQGAKFTLCPACNGTGKIVRHREIVRSFELRTRYRFVGTDALPQQQLLKAEGELVYSAEVDENLHPEAPPDAVPLDIWQAAVEEVRTAAAVSGRASAEAVQSSLRPTLQVLELVRIPYIKVDYRYIDRDYTLYIYDGEGHEKFYAASFPPRWDRIERLVRAITSDLATPTQLPQPFGTSENSQTPRGYRVPVEKPPYTISESDEEEPL